MKARRVLGRGSERHLSVDDARVEVAPLATSRGVAHRWLRADGVALRWGEVIEGWIESASFRERFIDALRGGPAGYFWETPCVEVARLDRAFECVLVENDALPRTAADPRAFAERLAGDGAVTRFASLGGDATLVVPLRRDDSADYGHLAAFTRTASLGQQHALWVEVGGAVQAWVRASERAVWVSTSGLAVPWLHVRLDARPKYYAHAPFRDP